MRKVIPLTTEIAVRQHTRKIFLESIRRILEDAGAAPATGDDASMNPDEKIDVSAASAEEATDFSGVADYAALQFADANASYLADLASTIGGGLADMAYDAEKVNQHVKAQIGQWAMIVSQPGADGYGMGDCVNWLDDIVTFPVSAAEFSKLYAFWGALIELDDESLTLTRHLMGLYAHKK